MVPAVITPPQGSGVNSSAPISGVAPFLTSPSISFVITAIGVPWASREEILGAVPFKCKLVEEIKKGSTAMEFPSNPVAVCHAAIVERPELKYPREPNE